MVRVKGICRGCLPYLIIKRQQALLALKFPINKRGRGGKRISQRNLELRGALKTELTVLNKRGSEAA